MPGPAPAGTGPVVSRPRCDATPITSTGGRRGETPAEEPVEDGTATTGRGGLDGRGAGAPNTPETPYTPNTPGTPATSSTPDSTRRSRHAEHARRTHHPRRARLTRRPRHAEHARRTHHPRRARLTRAAPDTPSTPDTAAAPDWTLTFTATPEGFAAPLAWDGEAAARPGAGTGTGA